MNLASYLDAKRLSADDFADKAGVHRATIYRLLKGKGYMPKGDTIQRIEAASGGKVKLFDLVRA